MKLVAARMNIDPEHDTRPALLVHLSFAAADFAFQQWVRTFDEDHPPLQELVAHALHAVKSSRWQLPRSSSAPARKGLRR